VNIRPDVEELLRAGYSNGAIARQLNTCTGTVAAARTELGLPKAKPGPKPATTAEDLFWRRIRPVDGGHFEWDGYRTNDGTPSLRHGGRLLSANRIAFRLKHQREPEGYALPGCGHDGCVAPDHMDDRLIRQRNKTTYNAIFGA
jgi:hypothetical protein